MTHPNRRTATWMARLLAMFLVAATFIALSAVRSVAVAADLARFDGRTIEFMVGSKPGGGYDRTTRLVAEFLEKALPGAQVVVSNQYRMGGPRRFESTG